MAPELCAQRRARRARRRARARLRDVGSDSASRRRRSGRCTARATHDGRDGRGEGAVSRASTTRSAPTSRRPICCSARCSHDVPGPRPRAARRRAARPARRRARLRASKPRTSASSPTTTRATRSSASRPSSTSSRPQRVLTTEYSDGARFAEVEQWSQAERDLAAEAIYRFVFRSIYRLHAFNGDPHPGNYLFRPQRRRHVPRLRTGEALRAGRGRAVRGAHPDDGARTRHRRVPRCARGARHPAARRAVRRRRRARRTSVTSTSS